MQRDNELTFNRFISIAARCAQTYFDRELSPMNIGAGQIRILRALDIKNGINQESIRRLFHLDKGTVAKTIKPLIREGYIRREKNPNDKRSYQIFLTDKGRSIMPTIKQSIRSWTEILTAGFTDEEKRSIHDFLFRMSENARNHVFDQTSKQRRES